jgi:hypothetical protein
MRAIFGTTEGDVFDTGGWVNVFSMTPGFLDDTGMQGWDAGGIVSGFAFDGAVPRLKLTEV